MTTKHIVVYIEKLQTEIMDLRTLLVKKGFADRIGRHIVGSTESDAEGVYKIHNGYKAYSTGKILDPLGKEVPHILNACTKKTFRVMIEGVSKELHVFYYKLFYGKPAGPVTHLGDFTNPCIENLILKRDKDLLMKAKSPKSESKGEKSESKGEKSKSKPEIFLDVDIPVPEGELLVESVRGVMTVHVSETVPIPPVASPIIPPPPHLIQGPKPHPSITEDYFPPTGFSQRYRLNKKGNLKNFLTGKDITCPVSNGYKTFYITPDNTKKENPQVHISLHRLLYSTFLGPLVPGMCIDHRDGNKLNNSLSNLRQVSYSENSQNRTVPPTYDKIPIACLDPFYMSINDKYPGCDFRDYSINKKGQVKSKNGAIMKPGTDPERYTVINLTDKKSKKQVNVRLNRLVAFCFLPPPLPEQTVVNHINSKIHDNSIDNLEWTTVKKNAQLGRCKVVNQYTKEGEYMFTWSSITEAQESLSIGKNSSQISRACKTKSLAHGYRWAYVEVKGGGNGS